MTADDSLIARQYQVSGKVQGVSFRVSAQAAARQLGLTGWVCNLPGGRVETVAYGPRAAIEQFEQWLRRGPRYAAVTAVTSTDCAAPSSVEFVIR